MTRASSIVLFDGSCGLCNGFVRFVIQRDARGRFAFASLQSSLGCALLAALGRAEVAPEGFETVVLIEGDSLYERSAAVLRVLRQLGWPWSFARFLLRVPAPALDAVYRLVARNRHRWSQGTGQCLLPTGELRRRFLH